MKKIVKPALWFAMGFLVTLLIHQAYRCSDDYGDYGNKNDQVDTKIIEEHTVLLENALLSGDQEQVKDRFSDDALDLYQEVLAEASSEEMVSMGTSIKSRELVFATEMLAEFSFIDQGTEYTFSMMLDANGEWKLLRF